MAYITTEEVKEIRNRIKAAYPAKDGWKFSIRQKDHTSLHVSIISAPVKFIEDGTCEQVNHYHINSSRFSPEHKALLDDINSIANETNWDKSEPVMDYFNCHFYFYLNIGDYDNPFQYAEGHSIEDKLKKLGF